LQLARPRHTGRREHDRERLLQGSVQGTADGVRRRSAETSGRELGRKRGIKRQKNEDFMTEEQLNDARTLWKMIYARDTFLHVQSACEFVSEQKLKIEHPAYYSLIVAIHVLYGRPFLKSNEVGKLKDDIVPNEHKKIHDATINHRSWLYAHTDANAPTMFDGESANQVRFVRHRGIVNKIILCQSKSLTTTVKDISILCEALLKITEHHIAELRAKSLSLIPNEDGDYVLNVSSVNQPFVSKAKPIVFN
jgi:hypothetical protein